MLFDEENKVDPARVIRLVQEPRSRFRLDGPLKLRFQAKLDREEDRLRFIAELLGRLALAANRADRHFGYTLHACLHIDGR